MKIFESARLRLTLWYTLVIMVVSITFSLGIYSIQTYELTRFEAIQRERIENRIYDSAPQRARNPLVLDEGLVTEAKQRIIHRLGLINGILMIVSTGFGYFLSGKTLRPIERVLKDQENFISDASHELRTPLTAMRTSLEVFLRGKNPTLSSATALIKGNLDEAIRLQSLSDSLLDLSTGSLDQASFQELELKDVINSALTSLAPLAKKRRIKIALRGKAVSVRGSHSHLRQLFVILIDNAIKYSPVGKGKVSITLSQKGRSVTVTVKDNGKGIDQDDLPHVFDRFYRADSSRSRGGSGGYGLGLAIAKKIMDDHNGEISVNSLPSKGSTFQVTFRKHQA